MVSLVFLGVALLCFGTAVLRQRSWRARRGAGATPVLPALAALGCALVLIAPVTQELLSAVVPGAGRLSSNACTLIAAFAFSEMLGYLHGTGGTPGGRRRRAGLLVVVLTVLVVTFALGRPPQGPVALFSYRDDLALTVYVVVYALYLGFNLVRMLLLAVRAVGRTRRRLRLSMVVLAAGCVVGLAYAVSRVTTAVGAYAGAGPDGAERWCAGQFENLHCSLAVGFPALSVALIVLGLGVPFLLDAPAELRRWVTDLRLARALRPLWRAMYEALPQIALTSPGAVAGSVPHHDASLRLYRRTVELRDGALLLQPYRTAADTAEHRRRAAAAGLRGERADDAVEAADLAVALARYREAGSVPGAGPAGGPGPGEPGEPAADDPRAEARRLARVSAAFARGDLAPPADQSGNVAR
ncbi:MULTISPECIES: MAB_1171c family putative transporter [unclassified Pseudonocardia]|uniref:MAB_1171c family putative transporter n=1 Tax=unclassified Pseudonocardia TaxID=2619320 RepID=UPI000761BE03|nr:MULTISPECIES: MAB_1171c family putative transporter [unclassified Pseudonocardia]